MLRLLPPRYKAEFILAMVAMFLFGALDMIRGVVAPTLLKSFGLNFTYLGLLLSASSFGYFASSLVSGFLVDLWGLKATLLFGNVLILAGVGGTVLSKGFLPLAGSFLLSGLGNGMMEIATNSIVPRAAESEQSRYFNVLHAIYGVGATVSPLVAGYAIVVWKSWRLPYIGALGILLPVLVCSLFLRYPLRLAKVAEAPVSAKGKSVAALPALGPVEVPDLEPPSRLSPADETTIGELLRRVSLHTLLVGITVYVIAEVGVANWLPTLLHSARALNTDTGAEYLTGFFLLYTIGRFIGSVFVHKIGSARAVVISSLLALMATGTGLFGGRGLALFFIVAGLFFGTIFPTISAMTAENFPQRTGTVLGFLFAGAGLGATISSWVIGRLSDIFGVTAGFSTVLGGLFITALTAVLFPWLRAHERGVRKREGGEN